MQTTQIFSDFIANVKALKFTRSFILASVIMQKMMTTNLKESIQGEYIVDHIEYQIFEHVEQFKCAGKLYVNLDSVSVELIQSSLLLWNYKFNGTKCNKDIYFKLGSFGTGGANTEDFIIDTQRMINLRKLIYLNEIS